MNTGSQDGSLIVTSGGGAHRSSFIAHRSFPRSPIPQANTQHNDERRRFNDLPLAPPLLNERVMLRRILRHPGRSLLTILTLALGLGATTAVVSAIYSVLL